MHSCAQVCLLLLLVVHSCLASLFVVLCCCSSFTLLRNSCLYIFLSFPLFQRTNCPHASCSLLFLSCVYTHIHGHEHEYTHTRIDAHTCVHAHKAAWCLFALFLFSPIFFSFVCVSVFPACLTHCDSHTSSICTCTPPRKLMYIDILTHACRSTWRSINFRFLAAASVTYTQCCVCMHHCWLLLCSHAFTSCTACCTRSVSALAP